MLIGKKLKELRKERKITLTELSKQSGVQLATLSRIENLKMTGTLESHLNIAKALGINITDLYSEIDVTQEKIDVHTSKSDTAIFRHSEKSSYEILTSNVLKKKMMPILLKIEPDGRTNTEQNKAQTEKFLLVLEGKVEVKIDKDTYSLSKHNTLYFDASLPHYINNIGKTTARVLCVVTPVSL